VCRSWKLISDQLLVSKFQIHRFHYNGDVPTMILLTYIGVLHKCTHLTSLDLSGNLTINSVRHLTNLIALNVSAPCRISTKRISTLTNLTSLKMTGNQRISNRFLRKCTNLTLLHAGMS
jgi:hypothetical protein